MQSMIAGHTRVRLGQITRADPLRCHAVDRLSINEFHINWLSVFVATVSSAGIFIVDIRI